MSDNEKYYIDVYARYQPNDKDFMGYEDVAIYSLEGFIDVFYYVLFEVYEHEESEEETEEYKHKKIFPKEIINKYPNKLNDYFNWIEEMQEKYDIKFIIAFVNKKYAKEYYEFTRCLGTIGSKDIKELPDEFELYNGDNGHYDYSCRTKNIDYCLEYILKLKQNNA